MNYNKRNPTCYILSQNLHEININLLKANRYQSHANFVHFSHTLTRRCTSPRRSTLCIMAFVCTRYCWQCTIRLKYEKSFNIYPPKTYKATWPTQNPTRKRYQRAISSKPPLILITQTMTFVNTFQISGNNINNSLTQWVRLVNPPNPEYQSLTHWTLRK